MKRLLALMAVSAVLVACETSNAELTAAFENRCALTGNQPGGPEFYKCVYAQWDNYSEDKARRSAAIYAATQNAIENSRRSNNETFDALMRQYQQRPTLNCTTTYGFNQLNTNCR